MHCSSCSVSRVVVWTLTLSHSLSVPSCWTWTVQCHHPFETPSTVDRCYFRGITMPVIVALTSMSSALPCAHWPVVLLHTPLKHSESLVHLMPASVSPRILYWHSLMNDKKLLYLSVFASLLNVAVHPVSGSTMPRWILIKLSNCFVEHKGVAHVDLIALASAVSSSKVAKLNDVDEQHWLSNKLDVIS